jgi:hypothetical protein
MCLVCHMNLSNEQILGQLQKQLDKSDFCNYNSTSINHIYLAACGYNGAKAQELALELLDRFYIYVSNNYVSFKDNFESNGFHECPELSEIKKMINHVTLLNINNVTKSSDEIKEEILMGSTEYELPIKFTELHQPYFWYTPILYGMGIGFGVCIFSLVAGTITNILHDSIFKMNF